MNVLMYLLVYLKMLKIIFFGKIGSNEIDCHRGNISGPNKELENTVDYIDRALINYDAELMLD